MFCCQICSFQLYPSPWTNKVAGLSCSSFKISGKGQKVMYLFPMTLLRKDCRRSTFPGDKCIAGKGMEEGNFFSIVSNPRTLPSLEADKKGLCICMTLCIHALLPLPTSLCVLLFSLFISISVSISNQNLVVEIISWIAPICQSLCSLGTLWEYSTSFSWLLWWQSCWLKLLLEETRPDGGGSFLLIVHSVPFWQVMLFFFKFLRKQFIWQPAILAMVVNTGDSNSRPKTVPANTGLLGNMLTLKLHVVVILILEEQCGTNCQYRVKLQIVLVQVNTDIQS